MSPVKRILVLLMIPVFLINCMGYYIIFGIRQNLIRSEMLKSIREGSFHEEMVCIKIVNPEKNAGYKRVDKNEFTLSGVFYDVIAEHKTGDTTVFYCLHDRKEESLIKHFECCYLHRNRHKDQQNQPIRALLQNFISEAVVISSSEPDHYSGMSLIYHDFKTSLFRGYSHVHSPPPKIFCTDFS